MVDALTLDHAFNLITTEQNADDLATHLLLAHPESQSWAVVSLRSPLSISIAIGTGGLVPVCEIATVELQYWSHVDDSEELAAVLLGAIAARGASPVLISFLECYNTLEEILHPPEPDNELPSKP